MPTTRPRTQVTHTREVEDALEIARSRWPDESPSALLMHLVVRGGQAIRDEQAQRARARRGAVDAMVEKFAGIYPEEYLSELREDWPE
ncbi:hypothetical protein [Microbacterium sp. BH-3-3-3]|uniref:hypothetical protein n=1 Tax=Microbacterium sp. BH-3-3-3 TaxID=1906742 RepID=UPI001643511C|nr:hypothetical protein [Microbacterium sp. BH-3-3-3]